MIDAAAGTTHLLVVGNDRSRRLIVNDEAEVGLVVPHPEGRGRDQALYLVSQQQIFEVLAIGVGVFEPIASHAAVVGPCDDAMLIEPVGDLVRISLGQCVDDPVPEVR